MAGEVTFAMFRELTAAHIHSAAPQDKATSDNQGTVELLLALESPDFNIARRQVDFQ